MAVVPDLDSPSWGTIAEPLWLFLATTPSTIKEVLIWARQWGMSGDMTRNALAWLSLVGKAYFDESSGRWKTGCLMKPSDIYVPSPVEANESDIPVDMKKLLRLLDGSRLRIPAPSPNLKILSAPSRYDKFVQCKKDTIRMITLGDRTMSIGQWARETGLSFSTISGRLAMGWTPERILEEPCHAEKRRSIARSRRPP